MKLKRGLSPGELIKVNKKALTFEGKWNECFGNPEPSGTIFIWGQSGSGKTTFLLQLCKHLSNYGKGLFNSLEEGYSESLRLAFIRNNMAEVGNSLLVLNREPIDVLKERLRKRRKTLFAVIDSIQYTGMNYKAYSELTNEFPETLFIVTSHADGKEPQGRPAKAIRYDASIKVRVDGYRAFIKTRYRADNKDFDIWKEKADKYHGFEIN